MDGGLKTKKPELAGSGFSVSLYCPQRQKTPATTAPKNRKTKPMVVRCIT